MKLNNSRAAAQSIASALIEFEYQQTSGEFTVHRGRDPKLMGPYLVICDPDTGTLRTFRVDRVTEWRNGSEQHLPIIDLPPLAKRVVTHAAGLEILFVGFDSEERGELEAHAVRAGFVVDVAATGRLAYVCIGPRRLVQGLKIAVAVGARAISRSDFEAFVFAGRRPPLDA